MKPVAPVSATCIAFPFFLQSFDAEFTGSRSVPEAPIGELPLNPEAVAANQSSSDFEAIEVT